MNNKEKHNKKRNSTVPNKVLNNRIKVSFSELLAQKYSFIIISLLTLITYSGSFNNNLVSFDDNTIMENIQELKKSSLSLVNDSFRLDAMVGTTGMFYRPFQTFILIVLSFFGSYKSYVFFLLLVHTINANLLYYLMTLFNFNRKKSLLLALVFSVHPLFTSIINWIPSIGDASVTLFVLFSFIFFIKYFEKPNPLFLVFHIIGFFFAVLSKEIALFYPLVCILYIVLFKGIDLAKKMYREILIVALTWIILLVTYLLLREANVHTDETESAKIGITTFIFNVPILFQFIFKFFVPVNLSLISMNSWIRTFGGLLLALLFIYIAFKQRNKNIAIFSMVWFTFFLIPTIIFKHPHYDYLEHRGYLPLVSMILLLSSVKLNKYENLILLILIPVLCVTSFSRTKNFSDPIRFYNSVIKNEKVPMAYNNLAIENDYSQDFQSALMNFKIAIELNPSYTDAFINRGNLKSQRLNNFSGAISDYKNAIRLIMEDEILKKNLENYADVYNNMGTAKFRLNDVSGALIDYSKALEIKPDFARAYYNRGILNSEKLLDFNGALVDFTKAIEIEPNYYEAYTNRGVIKEIHFKDYNGALLDYNKAISIKPDFAMAYFNRGMFYKNLSDLNNACKDWQAASNLGHAGALQMIQSLCK